MERETSAMSIRDIPDDLRIKFKIRCMEEGKTMQQVFIELMTEYVNDKPKTKKEESK